MLMKLTQGEVFGRDTNEEIECRLEIFVVGYYVKYGPAFRYNRFVIIV